MNMSYPLPTSKEPAQVSRAPLGRGGHRALDCEANIMPSGTLLLDDGHKEGDPWDALSLVLPDVQSHAKSGAPLVDYHRDHPTSKAFDLLRTRLVQALRQNSWSRIAIAAPTTGCGATFTAVNLALSLARVPGSRSVLIDLDQRKPGVATALGLQGNWPINDFLSGRALAEEHMVRLSDTLALALNSEVNVNASEQLHDHVSAAVLEDTEEDLAPDVMLYDMPAMLEYDDLTAFLPQVDGVLLVADGTRTTKRQIEECERILDGQTALLGVVLNRGRDTA